jgi:hypothetical protein
MLPQHDGYRTDIDRSSVNIRDCECEDTHTGTVPAEGSIMNTRNATRRGRIARASAALALASGVALAGAACGAGTSTAQAAGSGGARAERPAYLSHLAPADRLEETIRREAERRHTLAEQYSGMPADRIERRIELEETTSGRSARTLLECAGAALAQRPLFTADTAERLVVDACG